MTQTIMTTHKPMAKRWAQRNGCVHQRPAFAYFLALGTGMIVLVIGLSAIVSIRLEGRSSTEEIDLVEASTLAFAGIEHAMSTITANGLWRSFFVHGVVGATHSLGAGEFSWMLFDEGDQDLSDDSSDPVIIVAVATVNRAVYQMRVSLEFSGIEFAINGDSKFREATNLIP